MEAAVGRPLPLHAGDERRPPVGADRASLLKLPKEGDDAAWGDVWAKLGRPESPDKYDLKADTLDPATLTTAREAFHKLGLTGRQASALIELQGQITQQQQAALAEKGITPERLTAFQEVTALSADTVAADLKKEWGAAFDDKLHAAKRALREVAPPEVAALMEATGLGNHPAMIKLFAAIGGGRAESALKGGGGASTGGPLTPGQAQAEIKALQGDSGFSRILMNRDDPGYRAAREKWDALHAFAYGASA
jgi:hypothetical protein